MIKGKSFDECKSEYDRICTGVKEKFATKCSLEKLIFSDMTVTDDECIAVFQMTESHNTNQCTCIGVTLIGNWKQYYEKTKILDFFDNITK